MNTRLIRRVGTLVAALTLASGAIVALGSGPASATTSAGCSALNASGFDATYTSSYQSSSEFAANDVIVIQATRTTSDQPEDLTEFPNGDLPGTVVAHIDSVPGTLSFVVPAAGTFAFGWGSATGSAAWSVSCTPFGQPSAGCSTINQIGSGLVQNIAVFGSVFIKGERLMVNATGPANDPVSLSVNGQVVASSSTLPATLSYIFTSTTAYDDVRLSSASTQTDWQTTCTPWQQLVPTIRLAQVPDTAVVGQSLQFTATVDSAYPSLPPTGTVSFFADGSPAGAIDLASGSATYTRAFLTAGAHQVLASYNGDPYYHGETTWVNLTVSPAATTTSITASPTSQVLGQPVTVSGAVAPVAPGAGTPTGSVTIFDGSTQVATATLSNGSYSASVSTLPVGNHSLHASYAGDGNYTSSSSSDANLVITRIPTSLTADPAHFSVRGSVVSARLTVASSGAPVAGQSLVFRAGPATLCTATTDATGRGTCTSTVTGQLAVALHRGYTVSYAGSAAYLPSSASAGVFRG